MSYNNLDKFMEEIAKSGLTPPTEIIPDGNIHRFKQDGSKGTPGWYCYFPGVANDIDNAAFGC